MPTHTFIQLWLVLAVGMTACSFRSAEDYYRQGRQHYEVDEPVAAMEAFIASTRVPSHEYSFKARSFSNMATMCRIGERHELAYELYSKSLEQFAQAMDTLAQAYALNNMAWEQAVLGNKMVALQLVDSAVSLCPDAAVMDKVLESKAASCLYAADYDSVLFYAQQNKVPSVYFDILKAQAYTFLGNNDSALFYAKQVVTQTDNPRYLDDVYYILTHCDSTTRADEVRALAAARTDIQMNLERNRPEWMEAVLMAEESLKPRNALVQPKTILLVCGAIILLIILVSGVFVWYRKRQNDSLERQYFVLRKSANLREELHWNDYTQFSAVCNNRLAGIVDKLEQKGLSEREIRICVLVLIGFSYAEIAEVLFRAESGIGKDKYTIAKHLGVSVKDLQTTLRTIANDNWHA